MKSKQKRGISIITLVITIVVIVILTGAIVLSISNNNPINQAQKAVIMQDITQMIEQHDIIYANELGKNKGNIAGIDISAFEGVVPEKYQPDFVALVEGIEYNCKDNAIKDIIEEMNTNKVILACEKAKPKISNVDISNITETTAEITITTVGNTISSYKYSIDGGITYKESSTNVISITDLASGTKTIVKIKVIDSSGYESEEKEITITTKTIVEGITIPEGFYYVGGTKNTGIVISDNSLDKDKGDSYEVVKNLEGNQYVWIPVASSSEFIRRDWNKGRPLSSCSEPAENGYATETAEYNEMKAKVLENEGFYIGRYEASNNNGIAESKALKMPWNKIKWNSNNEMSTEPTEGTVSYEGRHVGEKLGYTSVQSTLTYSIQWDSALKFIENKGISVVDSTSWGNYYNSEFTFTTSGYDIKTKANNTGALITTGATDRHMKQNIFDMAGNANEWTMEVNENLYRCIRGGEYGVEGAYAPAANRISGYPTGSATALSFRVSLYLK